VDPQSKTDGVSGATHVSPAGRIRSKQKTVSLEDEPVTCAPVDSEISRYGPELSNRPWRRTSGVRRDSIGERVVSVREFVVLVFEIVEP